MSNLKFARAMFTSKGMETARMGQKVLRAERRARRGWPRPARSTTGYGLCSFLDMADAHGLAWRWWFICLRTDGEREIVSAERRLHLRASVRLRRRTIGGGSLQGGRP